jgi:hypothetical protein
VDGAKPWAKKPKHWSIKQAVPGVTTATVGLEGEVDRNESSISKEVFDLKKGECPVFFLL